MSGPRPSSPFKGLNAFEDTELDALLFFGREREREIVAANLTAARLTVLYGPSGVGKSSLLRAAVARTLRELPEAPLVVVCSRWSDHPGAALAEAVAEAGGEVANGSALAALEQAQRDRDVYLVIDQAEEYFLYHADDDGPGSLAQTLAALLGRPCRVNVLVSLREDTLAKLDRFTGRIPDLFANTLRLDRLDRAAARAAIVRPVERFAELTESSVAVEPELVERVLDDVVVGRIEPSLGGVGAAEGAVGARRIEAPYLQLVMQRLWDEERAAGSSVLRLETLDRLGGARHIVEEHLEGAMAELTAEEKNVAARLFNHLVTPSGTKIAHDAADLADFGGVTVAELEPVLKALSERRILRSIEEARTVRYEIFHDVLAQPVLAWRTRHRTERELERKLADAHRRRRRLRLLFVLVLTALGLMTAVSVYAFSQRNEARQQAREADTQTLEAKALELEARARRKLASDPELGLLLAREAALLAHTSTSAPTLAAALEASRVRRTVKLGAPVLAAVPRSGGLIAATADGAVVTVDRHTGRVRTTIETRVPTTAASFSDGGAALLTARDGKLRLVGANGSVRRVPAESRRGAVLSPDGRRAVVFDATGTARLVDVRTGDLILFLNRAETLAARISRDGTLVATGHAGMTLRLWNTTTGSRFLKLFARKGDIVAVALGPGGHLVASASTNGITQLWNVDTGDTVAMVGGGTNHLTDVEFSPDGKFVAIAGRDRTVRVSNVHTSSVVATLRGHTRSVTSAVFVGQNAVLSASADRTVRIWDARPDRKLAVHGTLARLLALADRRVAATGRVLTSAERARYLR